MSPSRGASSSPSGQGADCGGGEGARAANRFASGNTAVSCSGGATLRPPATRSHSPMGGGCVRARGGESASGGRAVARARPHGAADVAGARARIGRCTAAISAQDSDGGDGAEAASTGTDGRTAVPNGRASAEKKLAGSGGAAVHVVIGVAGLSPPSEPKGRGVEAAKSGCPACASATETAVPICRAPAEK